MRRVGVVAVPRLVLIPVPRRSRRRPDPGDDEPFRIAGFRRTEQGYEKALAWCVDRAVLMVGISVGDTTLGTAIANLGWDEVRFPKPLFHGDTVRVQTEVVELRESRSRPDAGIVTFLHRAYNQRGELVAHCKRSGLQRKRPQPAESAP